MKSLKQFVFEYRVKNEITIKCEQTKEVIDPEYVIYDQESLDDYVQKFKNNKENFENKAYFFVIQKGKDWLAQTKHEFQMNVDRATDKFLTDDNQVCSYDELVKLLETGEKMLIVVEKR